MIILIIGLVLAVGGALATKALWNRQTRLCTDLAYISSLSFGIVLLLCSLICLLGSRVGINQKIYEAKLKRESIVEEIEALGRQENSPMTATVIQDVRDWNIEVSNVRYWAENPWTNIFWSTRYVDAMEYIDMDDYL